MPKGGISTRFGRWRRRRSHYFLKAIAARCIGIFEIHSDYWGALEYLYLAIEISGESFPELLEYCNTFSASMLQVEIAEVGFFDLCLPAFPIIVYATSLLY